MRTKQPIVVIVLVLVLMGTSFLLGHKYASWAAEPGLQRGMRLLAQNGVSVGSAGSRAGGVEDVQLSPLLGFQEALNQVRTLYVEEVKDESKLTYGAIRGMLASLSDPYTRLMEPKEYQDFMGENQGHFEGIGATLGMREVKPKQDQAETAKRVGAPVRCPVCGSDVTEAKLMRPTIIAPLPGSPAQRAGLRAEDTILKVDDLSTDGISLSEVVKHIKGPAGTKVTLLVGRRDATEPVKIVVTRGPIDVPAVESKMLGDGVGYLKINTFSEKARADVERGLRSLRTQGMKGLLLDVRNNPGGSLRACLEVAALFVKGPAVYIQERGGSRRPQQADNGGKQFDLPLVMLVNKGSASASEILAGAIQDEHAGKVIGQTTFGKGLVQTVVRLSDGSALAITTAKYFTPSGRDVNEKGITPDKVVELAPDIEPMSDKDVQKHAALEALKQAMGVVQAAK